MSSRAYFSRSAVPRGAIAVFQFLRSRCWESSSFLLRKKLPSASCPWAIWTRKPLECGNPAADCASLLYRSVFRHRNLQNRPGINRKRPFRSRMDRRGSNSPLRKMVRSTEHRPASCTDNRAGARSAHNKASAKRLDEKLELARSSAHPPKKGPATNMARAAGTHGIAEPGFPPGP